LAESTDPAAVPGGSGVSVLPPTNRLQVRVVVANQGNVEEKGVRLVVTAVAQGSRRAVTPVRMTTDIAVGRSVALSPPALSVRQATTYLVDMTATARGGASAGVSLTLRVSVVPTTTTTTTTTVPRRTTTTVHGTTSTTVPGKTSTTVHGG
jgi:hypothetical protein